MGKTYRNEKSFKPKKRSMKGLNTHRDLPDYPEYFDDSEDDQGYNRDVEEYTDAERVRPKKSNNFETEGRQNPKNDKG